MMNSLAFPDCIPVVTSSIQDSLSMSQRYRPHYLTVSPFA